MKTREFKHKIQWTASLSNGETFFEGKGDYKDIQDGRKSPIQRLFKYVTRHNLEITSFGLYHQNGTTIHLPSLSKRYNIGLLESEARPIDYNLFRYVDAEVSVSPEDSNKEIKLDPNGFKSWWTVAEGIYENFRVQIWVDENNPKNSRVHILPSKK